jgi:hypothetical protein
MRAHERACSYFLRMGCNTEQAVSHERMRRSLTLIALAPMHLLQDAVGRAQSGQLLRFTAAAARSARLQGQQCRKRLK